MDIPGAQAWESFTGTAAVVIFLSSLLSAVGGAVAWKAWLFRRSEAKPVAEVPAASPTEPSPEALALIEAARALVEGMQAITERSEVTGRVHKRLDEVNQKISASTTEVAELKGQLVQMNKTLHLIHEHLLRQK